MHVVRVVEGVLGRRRQVHVRDASVARCARWRATDRREQQRWRLLRRHCLERHKAYDNRVRRRNLHIDLLGNAPGRLAVAYVARRGVDAVANRPT